MDKKTAFILTLYNTILFTVIFTVVGGLVNGFDWKAVPGQAAIGFIIGFCVGSIIPVGDFGGAVAAKLFPPGTRGFGLVMNQVTLLIMLVFMCPLMTIAFGSILGGAPIMAGLSASFNLFIPFYIVGSIVLELVGSKVTALAIKTAHPNGMPNE